MNQSCFARGPGFGALKKLAGLTILGFALSVSAYDGSVAGKIAGINVAAGNNFGFRVSLSGSPILCTGGPAWAYLNDPDSNYKVFVAALLAAKSAGSSVTLWTANVSGYCHIEYISVGS